jgi:predicted enzyme related to lactoylglutathione lyase
MITAVHLLIYSDDPEATRRFLRVVLEWPHVEDDSDPGWLIFGSGPSEIGVHPTNATYEGVTYDYPRHHSISLICDDIEKTKADLESKGAEFTRVIEKADFGRTLWLKGARCRRRHHGLRATASPGPQPGVGGFRFSPLELEGRVGVHAVARKDAAQGRAVRARR